MENIPCTRAFTWLYNEPRDFQINTAVNVLIVNALQGFKHWPETVYRKDKPDWYTIWVTLLYHFLYFVQLYFVQAANPFFNRDYYNKLLKFDHSWYHDNINSWE